LGEEGNEETNAGTARVFRFAIPSDTAPTCIANEPVKLVPEVRPFHSPVGLRGLAS
jgi:hypothetical protein